MNLDVFLEYSSLFLLKNIFQKINVSIIFVLGFISVYFEWFKGVHFEYFLLKEREKILFGLFTFLPEINALYFANSAVTFLLKAFSHDLQHNY